MLGVTRYLCPPIPLQPSHFPPPSSRINSVTLIFFYQKLEVEICFGKSHKDETRSFRARRLIAYSDPFCCILMLQLFG